MKLETLDDLSATIEKIDLPISVRYSKREWMVNIKWTHPDFSRADAVGRGATMLEAVTACLVDYEKQVRS